MSHLSIPEDALALGVPLAASMTFFDTPNDSLKNVVQTGVPATSIDPPPAPSLTTGARSVTKRFRSLRFEHFRMMSCSLRNARAR